jgi:hypothetical protein
VFQGVGMLFSGAFVKDKWAEGEKRECRFVFIGKNLGKEALLEGFLQCRCTEELRFKVGDQVLARVGPKGYTPGRILKLWDEGNACVFFSFVVLCACACMRACVRVRVCLFHAFPSFIHVNDGDNENNNNNNNNNNNSKNNKNNNNKNNNSNNNSSTSSSSNNNNNNNSAVIRRCKD